MHRPNVAVFLAAGLLLFTLPAVAEDDLGWSTKAEVGWVATGGNSESQTIALSVNSTKKMATSSFKLKAGVINAETTTTSREAFGTTGSFGVVETDTTSTSAESYLLEGRYDHEISKRLFWFAGAGWSRNRPAGIDQRYSAFGGLGNVWRDEEKVKFRTDYGLSYNDQEDVVPSANSVNDYIGARGSWEYEHKFGESTTYINDFVVDFEIGDLDNLRADMLNAVQVAINNRVALKVSLRALFNNLPPEELINLFDAPGGTLIGQVPYELDKVDTIFAASVVINF